MSTRKERNARLLGIHLDPEMRAMILACKKIIGIRSSSDFIRMLINDEFNKIARKKEISTDELLEKSLKELKEIEEKELNEAEEINV